MNGVRAPSALPSGIWVLGFVSLLMDVSSEMIHSLLPVFLVTDLGASVFMLGLIEGTAESVALIVKVFSGALSDYLGRRKALAVAGYALGAASKPLFAVASSAGMVLGARLIDRVGKGMRGAPLDTVGAFLGPLLAVGLMLLWSNDFHAVFWIAAIPGGLAVALLVFGIHEPRTPSKALGRNPIDWSAVRRLSRAYWLIVLVGVAFTLARFAEAFLVLRAQQNGLPSAWVPLVMVAMNLVYALSAYPFGRLADRWPRDRLLILGLAVLVAADWVLASANTWGLVFLGVALWGLHMGLTQGLLSALIADAAPDELRGTAFGIYSLLTGLTMLISSVLAGLLWDRFGASATFLAGAVFAVLALSIGMLRWRTADGKR